MQINIMVMKNVLALLESIKELNMPIDEAIKICKEKIRELK